MTKAMQQTYARGKELEEVFANYAKADYLMEEKIDEAEMDKLAYNFPTTKIGKKILADSMKSKLLTFEEYRTKVKSHLKRLEKKIKNERSQNKG